MLGFLSRVWARLRVILGARAAYVSAVLPVGLNHTHLRVYVNGSELNPPSYPVITSNSTHYFVYFCVFFASVCEISILFDPVAATVDLKPETLNLASSGNYATAYIELPDSINLNDIVLSTILVNGAIPVCQEALVTIGDYDMDNVPDLMVKFGRAEVASFLPLSSAAAELDAKEFSTTILAITGELSNTQPFTGSDTVRIFERGCMPLLNYTP